MEEMIQQFATQMAAKVGISEEQAKMVIDFLKEHADEVPKLLASDAAQSVKDKLPGGLGDLF
jgi:hypothetical protein